MTDTTVWIFNERRTAIYSGNFAFDLRTNTFDETDFIPYPPEELESTKERLQFSHSIRRGCNMKFDFRF